VPVSYAKEPREPPEGWRAWISSFGGLTGVDGDAAGTGSHGVSAHAQGFAAGVTREAASGLTAGFAFSGAGTSWSLSDGLGRGK
jgi:hypothetical protein